MYPIGRFIVKGIDSEGNRNTAVIPAEARIQ